MALGDEGAGRVGRQRVRQGHAKNVLLVNNNAQDTAKSSGTQTSSRFAIHWLQKIISHRNTTCALDTIWTAARTLKVYTS